jgi:hypothetical protein
MTGLRFLSVSRTNLSDAGCKRLQAELTNCSLVVRDVVNPDQK